MTTDPAREAVDVPEPADVKRDPAPEVVDVPEADRLEQYQPALPDDPDALDVPPSDDPEAPEGDVLEQSIVVPLDEEDDVR